MNYLWTPNAPFLPISRQSSLICSKGGTFIKITLTVSPLKLAIGLRLLSIYNLVIASHLHIEQIRESDWGCIPMSTLKISPDCLVPGRCSRHRRHIADYRWRCHLTCTLHLSASVQDIKVRMEKLMSDENWSSTVQTGVQSAIFCTFFGFIGHTQIHTLEKNKEGAESLMNIQAKIRTYRYEITIYLYRSLSII